MCDHKFHADVSPRARVGAKLVSTRLTNSLTHGFATAEEPGLAAFGRDVECDGAFRLFRNRQKNQRVARFRQVYPDHRTAHHDALEFAETVMVTEWCEGANVRFQIERGKNCEARKCHRAWLVTLRAATCR